MTDEPTPDVELEQDPHPLAVVVGFAIGFVIVAAAAGVGAAVCLRVFQALT